MKTLFIQLLVLGSLLLPAAQAANRRSNATCEVLVGGTQVTAALSERLASNSPSQKLTAVMVLDVIRIVGPTKEAPEALANRGLIPTQWSRTKGGLQMVTVVAKNSEIQAALRDFPVVWAGVSFNKPVFERLAKVAKQRQAGGPRLGNPSSDTPAGVAGELENMSSPGGEFSTRVREDSMIGSSDERGSDFSSAAWDEAGSVSHDIF